MIQSPDAALLKKRPRPSSGGTSASKSPPSDTSRDEGEIVDRERLRTAAKKLKKKRGRPKTKKIKKRRKGTFTSQGPRGRAQGPQKALSEGAARARQGAGAQGPRRQ